MSHLRLGASAPWLAILLASSVASAAPADKIDRRVEDTLARKGQATFWVVLGERANVDDARALPSKAEKGRHVRDRLIATAERSQAGLRGMLRRGNVPHKAFWIANAIEVTADADTVNALAARPEVARIVPDGQIELPPPIIGGPPVQSVQWNISLIGADQVWAGFGAGEGITVASLDTGVDFLHEAIVRQYRGNLGEAGFQHDYNWFDPTGQCGRPGSPPCDTYGHGTHVTGTMVGGDGLGDEALEDIGVAPGARWIAANACPGGSCPYDALVASGQWILAPTDMFGNNPDPSRAPHVVNNSWGGGGGDPFFQDMVRAWRAAGIFPAFAIGNSGSACSTAGSPGDYPESVAVGATDWTDTIAWFSSRGPTLDGRIKPDLAAPGDMVYSSVPGGGYESWSGTSMATPHVSGTVALMWSGAPELIGDIDATLVLLADTARHLADPGVCGGDDEFNNDYGRGRIDALAAVVASPRVAGTLEGIVTEVGTGTPLAGVDVTVVRADDGATREVETDEFGHFALRLPVDVANPGDPEAYTVSGAAYGFEPVGPIGVEIHADATTVQDLVMRRLPSATLSGTVRDAFGAPIPGTRVTVLGTPIAPVLTGPEGTYEVANIPHGDYEVQAVPGGCHAPALLPVGLYADESLDFVLEARVDGFGYRCTQIPVAHWIEARDPLPLAGDDLSVPVPLPFDFPLYGQARSTVFVSSNGYLSFTDPGGAIPWAAIPDPSWPNDVVFGLGADLWVDDNVFTGEGIADDGGLVFVVEYRQVRYLHDGDLAYPLTFQIQLHERGGVVEMLYAEVSAPSWQRAIVGVEDAEGYTGLGYAELASDLKPGLGLRFWPPPSGQIAGVITDANDGLPLAEATVVALESGRSAVTGVDGVYVLNLPVGRHTLEVGAAGYETQTLVVDIAEDTQLFQDFALRSPRATWTPESMEWLLAVGEQRTAALTLGNVGTLPLTYEVREQQVRTVARAAVVPPAGTTTLTRGAAPRPVGGVFEGGPVLVFVDWYPWGYDSLFQVLWANDVPFAAMSSVDMAQADLSVFEAIFIANDQPAQFYDAYREAAPRFDEYVAGGGLLWFGAAAGYNGGSPDGLTLPGGARVIDFLPEPANDVLEPGHPLVQGVPARFEGSFASHAAFADLPETATVIAAGADSRLPTLVEYTHGAGRVLAFGQPLDIAWAWGWNFGRILENSVPYAWDFEPVIDVPWLSVTPTAGLVAPGATSALMVTVDTTGLPAGLHRAQVSLRTNDPRQPRIQVPVTVRVSTYRKGLDAGSAKAFKDRFGDTWAADRKWVNGSYGYFNARATTASTKTAIAGTTDDSLYQTLRRDPTAYRFQNVPNGTYQIEVLFCEIQKISAGKHYFDVIAEDRLLLPAHDTVFEVGRFTADSHVFLVPVVDGQLDVRFVARKGLPEVSAIRVTHRVDL